MMKRFINGIQQVGIGVDNAEEAFDWYRKTFGTDILVFKDTAPATLMQQYTGNTVHQRYAMLAINMQGGGGFEIWQFTSRKPQYAPVLPMLGDTGIFAVKIKCSNISTAHNFFSAAGISFVTPITNHPCGKKHFYLQDIFGNYFEVWESSDFFSAARHVCAGTAGVVIGVSCMEKSVDFYSNVLGYKEVLYSGEDTFADWQGLPGAAYHCKRVLLAQQGKATGAFGKLFGNTFIELVQVMGRKPVKIYGNRYWGDPGFIHVCFDINGMEAHEQICSKAGYPLTVNSRNSFGMGSAAGHFAYNEDPDGTLIEYVETHKVPILKKLGWYLNIKNCNPEKPLPNWMVKCLRFSRVK
jgi:catechol 2,3-dioxygenase-like lactoylglutathione lyase family enzyme